MKRNFKEDIDDAYVELKIGLVEFKVSYEATTTTKSDGEGTLTLLRKMFYTSVGKTHFSADGRYGMMEHFEGPCS